MADDELTPKQARFAAEYVLDLNATQAAIRAGYSKKGARTQGSVLLAHPNIARRIQKLLKPKMDRYEVTAEKTIRELARIAYANMGDVARWNESGVRFKPSEEIDPDAMAAIEEVSESVNEYGGSLKIKQHSKAQALKILAQYQGLLTEKVQHSADESFAALVLASVAAKKDS